MLGKLFQNEASETELAFPKSSMCTLLFRSFIGVLVPSVVIVFTFLIVLSLQMVLGYKLNNFTVNIPAFITAIAIADSMHLYLAWLYYKLEGMKNKEAVFKALGSNNWQEGLPMRYNPIDTVDLDMTDYRGSIVKLKPGTEYEIHSFLSI
jgi:hypothetical protein